MNYERSIAAVDGLAAHGFTDVVLPPGSRNTPLTLTALAHPSFTTHSILDERSAGFFALGLASAGRPAAVAPTSGTAVANLLPASVEAYHSHQRVAWLTADRPPNVRGTGANQTVAQIGLFGTFVEGGCDLIDARPLQSVLEWSHRGPVHINVPLDKPLEPSADEAAALSQLQKPKVQPMTEPEPVELSGEGIILGGPASPHLPGMLGDGLAGGGLMDIWLDQTQAEWVLQTGHSPVDPDVRDWLARHKGRRVRVGHGSRDEWGTPEWAPAAVGSAVDLRPEATAAQDAATEILESNPHSEPAIVAAVAQTAPELVVGNSLPARDMGLVARRPLHSMRGASGIDGVVSFAAGVAAAKGPTWCILGELSFQHDLGGLACAAKTEARYVVLDNGGGRIFDMLPIADGRDMQPWRTPQNVDLVQASQAFGLEAIRVQPSELGSALDGDARVVVVDVDAELGHATRKAAKQAAREAARLP